MRVIALALIVAALPARAADAELDFDPATFDRSVDVCQDPYAYANNTWLRTAKIPDDLPMWGPRVAVVRRNQEDRLKLAERAAAQVQRGEASGSALLVGAFFAAGMDATRVEAAGLAPVADDLKRIDAIAKREDVAAALAHFSAQGLDLAFNYNVWARGDDPARHIVYVEQGGLGAGERSVYLDEDEATAAQRKAYRKYIATLLARSGIAEVESQRDADAVLALETALAKASLSSEALADTATLFHVRQLADIQRLAPHVDLAGVLRAHGLDDVAEINLAQPTYFQALDQVLAKTDIATLRAWLRARLLDTTAPYLAETLAAPHAEFHQQAMRGATARPPRWRTVLGALDAVAFMPMSRLYVETYLPADAKPRALAMVADLRAAFRARIEKNTWLSDAGRRAALDKLDRMGAKIGYPDRWPDFAGLSFDAKDYAGNVRAALRFNVRRADAKIGQPVDRAEWLTPAHEVNARYDWSKNEIIFPAPMLLPPAFDPKLDAALNYAVLGIIIGHEMTHGFDDLGARFDAQGRLHEWWTADDKRRFEAMGTRIAARYDGFEIAAGQHVNGKQTLAENTADIGGLAIAYDALELAVKRDKLRPIDGLTPAQRFLLRYASIWRNLVRPAFATLRLKTDWHSPEQFRAIGPLADLPGFAAAFDCKTGSAMNTPDGKRIGIW